MSPRGGGAQTAPSPSLSSPGDGDTPSQHRDNGGVAAANYLTIIIVGYSFRRTRRGMSLKSLPVSLFNSFCFFDNVCT